MTTLFRAKILVLTFTMLISSSVFSNETLIYTERNHYELFRINENSYRLSLKNPGRYKVSQLEYPRINTFEIDQITLRPV